MLARSGHFPVEYLAGFERLIKDIINGDHGSPFNAEERADICAAMDRVIESARLKAGLV